MGQSVTIACPPAWALSSFSKFFEAVAHDEAAEFSMFDDQLQVVANDLQWKLLIREVVDSAACADDYAGNDDLDERFRREAKGLRFFTLTFDNLDVTRRVLRTISRAAVSGGDRLWIDTDYGWVIHESDLLEETDLDPDWDWRHTPSKG